METDTGDLASVVRNSGEFNHRQIDLLGNSLAAARSDLLALEAKGLLQGRRVGRKFVFSAPEDLADRFGRANR